ncbi:hypothetical protein [Nonomuraea sp. NPDC050783]|uniref:hypothetical protein n=1 Tax=Nonomuraea sp. NPDC050783 TaxID=3154634 RepID=UPI003467A47D
MPQGPRTRVLWTNRGRDEHADAPAARHPAHPPRTGGGRAAARVERFRGLPNAKAGFATEYVNRDLLGRRRSATVIFLAHSERLHEVHLGRHPKAEEVLWRPELQQPKRLQTGDWNVRYRAGQKGGYVSALTELVTAELPYCRIRYAF